MWLPFNYYVVAILMLCGCYAVAMKHCQVEKICGVKGIWLYLVLIFQTYPHILIQTKCLMYRDPSDLMTCQLNSPRGVIYQIYRYTLVEGGKVPSIFVKR